MKLNGWDEEQTIEVFRPSLSGSAEIWHDSLPEKKPNKDDQTPSRQPGSSVSGAHSTHRQIHQHPPSRELTAPVKKKGSERVGRNLCSHSEAKDGAAQEVTC